MGYTHYWTMPAHVGREQFAALSRATEKIVKEAEAEGIALAGPVGTGRPEVTDTEIKFNGAAAKEEDFETFALYPSQGADFCKTADRPYDTAVTACLAAALALIPKFRIGSDGTYTDWLPGLALYEKACGDKDRPLDLIFLKKRIADCLGGGPDYAAWDAEIRKAVQS